LSILVDVVAENSVDADLANVMAGVSNVFESLGRAIVCLGPHFQIVHTSAGVDALFGDGAAREMLGQQAQDVLGDELFGAGGTMRRALAAGERREGWGATVRIGARRPRLVSISGAPMQHPPGTPCDPRVAYVLVVRPAESEDGVGSSAPTLFSGLIGRSRSMVEIFHLIENLEESDATILLTGESGTGKELVARALHVHSHRRNKPFVAVNCGALPGELLESELFGHVRGAFTGALRDRAGRFEVAGSGTIFLDEVGDLPLPLQVKLLRVLQERTFERVGESVSRKSEARVIAATNKDLRLEIEEARFRDDLYYRLRVVPIEIPPLRQRREDIEPLARHLLVRVNARHSRNVRLSPDALQALMQYDWPGNVRELENALEYSVAVMRGETIHAEHLPQETREPAVGPAAAPAVGMPPPRRPAGERQRILDALQAHQWRRADAARSLGMSRTTLWRKMRELELQA
jgi:transcriptional regulator with PAS, ATPase and Fis domain